MTALAEPPALAPTPAAAPVVTPRTAPVDPVRAQRLRITSTVLGLLAVLMLGFVAFLAVASQLYQNRFQAVAHRDFRLALAEQVAPLGQPVPIGTPSAYLSIPSLGVHQVVLEGTTGGVLAKAPGRRRDSVLPGQVGTSVVVGRQAAFGGPFAKVAELRKGARIDVLTGQGQARYRVQDVRHDGDPLPAALPAGGGRLVLVTADGTPFLPQRAVYVDATLVGAAKPGYVPQATVPAAEQTLGVDRGAALPLALWSQALLLVAGGLVWLRPRWGRWPSYACGLPVVLLVVWNLYLTASRLLPNLL